jgi:CRP-like cAMP-binding protein
MLSEHSTSDREASTVGLKWPWAVKIDHDLLAKVNQALIFRTYKSGTSVCQTGTEADYWYGVVDGLVKMCSVTRNGDDLSFIGITAGGWFGEGTLLKKERRRYDVIALRDSRIVLMPKETFSSLIDVSPEFSRWLLQQLNERLSQFIALLANDRASSPDARVARTLAWMFNPYLYPAMMTNIPLKQEEIAHLASLSRARTNTALRELEMAGLIEVGYGHVKVLNLAGLRSY